MALPAQDGTMRRLRHARDLDPSQHSEDPAARDVARSEVTRSIEPSQAEPQAMIESLQRAAGNAAVSRLLSSQQSSPPTSDGRPLPPNVQSRAEGRLGSDLNAVRVHDGAAADAYGRALDADAVTVGHDIYLRQSVDPGTADGQRTLMHELTHVAQASGAPGTAPTGVSRVGSAAEREAARVSASGLSGPSAHVSETAPAGIAHRQAVEVTLGPVELEEEPIVTLGEAVLEDEPITPVRAPARPKRARSGKSRKSGKSGKASATKADAPNPLRDLYRVAVEQRIIAAEAALSGAKPDPAVAYRELDAAREGVRALVGSYKDDPLMNAKLRALFNAILSVIMAIQPHVGETKDLQTIAQHANGLLSLAAGVGSDLK
jgi:hypothetical protein